MKKIHRELILYILFRRIMDGKSPTYPQIAGALGFGKKEGPVIKAVDALVRSGHLKYGPSYRPEIQNLPDDMKASVSLLALIKTS